MSFIYYLLVEPSKTPKKYGVLFAGNNKYIKRIFQIQLVSEPIQFKQWNILVF